VALRLAPAGAHTAVVEQFVGRTRELAILDGEMQEARSGRPRIVLVEGDAGIGKSSLLSRFVSGVHDARVLRASGEESETLLAWGVVDQLVAAASAAAGPGRRRPGEARRQGADPLAVGAQLVGLLGDLQSGDSAVIVVVDDLHWSDQPSAQALLFTLRRMRADRVLGLVSARAGELSHLGEAWSRFAAGDDRATRLRLGGLSAADLAAMAQALGAGDLPGRAVAQLLEHTGGNSLHCRALLEELGQGGLAWAGGELPAPRALASVVLARLEALSQPAQGLVRAAAVLGRRCPLADAAALGGVADPGAALDEAAAAGLLAQEPAGADIAFAHPLVHAAVRDNFRPAERRRLHRAAAALVAGPAALSHRVAAAAGPDDSLAADLEQAALDEATTGNAGQAAAWLVQASAASPARPDQQRRLLDALATLLGCGDAAGALALWPAAARFGPSARRSGLLGHLDILCGRGSVVEAHLLEAWQAHDPDTEPLVGAAAATSLAAYLCTVRRVQEALSWGERAVAASAGAPAARLRALTVVAVSLTLGGRGPEGLARLSGLPDAAAEVPLGHTSALVVRGMCRLATDDVTGAVADLSVSLARLRAGISLASPGQCLHYLSDAEYRLGDWDNALIHSELAVSLAHDTDRIWDLAFVHGFAAVIPAARGDWQLAASHVEASLATARAIGTGTGVTTAARAGAELARACGDMPGVLSATAPARALGWHEISGLAADWRPLELEALIGLGRLQEAGAALAELEAAIPASGLASASMATARLRGSLAVAAGDLAAAEESFAAARQLAGGLSLPFELALLERDDGRRLRRAGDRQGAVACLRRARGGFTGLGARPYAAACEDELQACGAEIRPDTGPARWNLTAAELAVARLVSTGRSNREVAAELFVSVKAVEFHLGHVFDKVGIRSRKALASRLAAPAAAAAAGKS
jgi:DNA-binding CsgD family transcriptional regulator/tetratricopeptide (TPR) repeat protein